MKKQFLKILLIGIITSCFVMAFMGKNASAQWNNMANWNWGNLGNYWGNWGGSNWTMPGYGYGYEYGEDDDDDRQAAWHQTEWSTDEWGGTWMKGSFGPDWGMGEQGQVMEYSNPMTGMYVSYKTSGMGMGMGGPFAGYGGMFSPVAEASYGPYAWGGQPQIQSTPGWQTRGYVSGDLWGQSTSYYQAQPNIFAMGIQSMLGGLGGMFGGWGGFPGYNYGYGGYGGGYGSSLP